MSRSVRSVLPAVAGLIMAVTVTLTVTASLSAAGASARHHRVPSCTGFGRFHYMAAHPLIDNRSEKRGLVPSIDKLVCSAADHATIDIKSWFIRIEDPTIKKIVADLALMHRYHNVRVNVVVGRGAYPPYTHQQHLQTFASLKRWFHFAHVYSCMSSCWRAHTGNISHSKWITVSRLRQGIPAVLSTSANWSHQQFALTKQTGLLTVGHPALSKAFVGRYAVFVDCAIHHHCFRPLPKAHWVGSPGAWVYFSPATGDPIVDIFKRIRCGPRSHIDITSLLLTRPGVLRELGVLRHKGCTVRPLLEHPVTRSTDRALHPRCETIHDKSIIISTSNIHDVIAGSEDIGGGGIHGNDNVMVLTANPTTRRTYQSFFNYNWARSKHCKIER